MAIPVPPRNLMGLWRLYQNNCRSIFSMVADARDGRLPGVEPSPHGHGFVVVNEKAALAAMLKETA